MLSEAARFAEQVLEPLNQSGDREGAHWSAEGVAAAKGFKDAYRAVRRRRLAGARRGCRSSAASPCRNVLGSAVRELWGSANLAFKLCPMLTIGAVEALDAVRLAGTEADTTCRRW